MSNAMVPIPAWNGLHPLVVHFPIALLMVAPILMIVALLAKQKRAFLTSAFIVMALGTAGAWLAVATGEAAGHLAEGIPGVEPLLKRHEEMAESVRTVFTVLTLVFAALLAIPWALKREPPRAVRVGSYGALLAVYAGALVYLANTAHQGATLVHGKGVHALVAPGASGPGAPEPRAGRSDGKRASPDQDD
jgi:uncharacterized membrane protein